MLIVNVIIRRMDNRIHSILLVLFLQIPVHLCHLKIQMLKKGDSALNNGVLNKVYLIFKYHSKYLDFLESLKNHLKLDSFW